MNQIEKLIDRIIDRVNVNLREPAFDVGPYIRHLIPNDKLLKFYAFYGLTATHPLDFHFHRSNVAGSYFLGKCLVSHSLVYKSDIRGDELKSRGETFAFEGLSIPLHEDEVIRIRDSFLTKTLVHNNSHDPESPEEFLIQNTVSMPYANIHGAPTEGSFLGPFSTVDLTTLHDSVIGDFAYVQVGELAHSVVEAGRIWIRSGNDFEFRYLIPREVLEDYIRLEPGRDPEGFFMEFVETCKKDFEELFDKVNLQPPPGVPSSSSLSRYARIKGQCSIGEKVLVCQRAYLENAALGIGSNAQENCYIIDSRLEGYNVTAHGGKIFNARLGEKTFVGFNSFLRGGEDAPLSIGEECIVMPHTIIDLVEPVEVPPNSFVWGYIRNAEDLKEHTIGVEKLAAVKGTLNRGRMTFSGDGSKFVRAFQRRIEHILEANGAYYESEASVGHAQKGRNISFNLIQPYREGELKGLYPNIRITQ